MHLAPGDPVRLLLPDEATQEDIDRTRREWGLDRPLPVQYWQFLVRAIQGDFGRSLRFGEPVLKLLIERLPATIELALLSLCVSIGIAIPIGILSAVRHNSLWDHAGMTLALMGVSLPNFWMGIMLILLLGGYFNLLPVSGRIEYGLALEPITQFYVLDALLQRNWAAFWDVLRHLLMPAVTLGTALAAIVTRITRSSMLEVIRQDYVTTARAKGLGERGVIWRHSFRNAMLTVITILGLQLGALLAGSIIVETVFSWPGVGSLLIQAIGTRDYKLVQGIVLFFSLMYIAVNLLVDVLYTLVDPRIRL
ncbi:MAG: ABC transporter permease [Deltaproteobacteria bacterium]|nr:ABC transporter permease [Deltaproteobacteria bacterium]